jgi:hypothetical protein
MDKVIAEEEGGTGETDLDLILAGRMVGDDSEAEPSPRAPDSPELKDRNKDAVEGEVRTGGGGAFKNLW